MHRLIEFCLNHPLLAGATFASLVALVVYEFRLRGQAGVTVSTTQAVQLINQGATVVDVRDAARFASGHIVDAMNIQPNDLTANAQTRLKKKRPVLVVCETGSSSARLVNALRQAGFDKAWSLHGGLSAWEREKLPLVADKARAGAKVS